MLPDLPTLSWSEVPKLTCAQARQMTALATGRYGLPMSELMRRAGVSLAEFTDLLAPDGHILVVVGRGHNGGAGIAAACALAERGRRVWVVPTHEAENYSGVPKEQLERLAALEHVRVRSSLPKMKFGGVVDAAVGTGLSGPPRGRTLDVVTVLNNLGSRVVALDVPTGLGADDGSTPGDVVRASATFALALPKQGTAPGGPVGDLYVADLGLPDALFQDLGLEPFTPPHPWGWIKS